MRAPGFDQFVGDEYLVFEQAGSVNDDVSIADGFFCGFFDDDGFAEFA